MTPVARIPVTLSHNPQVEPIGWGEFNEAGQLVITVEADRVNTTLYRMALRRSLIELSLGYGFYGNPAEVQPTVEGDMIVPKPAVRDQHGEVVPDPSWARFLKGDLNVFDDVGANVQDAPKIDPSEEEN